MIEADARPYVSCDYSWRLLYLVTVIDFEACKEGMV